MWRCVSLMVLVACSSQEAAFVGSSPPPGTCAPGVAAMAAGAMFSTVQGALDAAVPGAPAIINVCPGVWSENLELPFAGDWQLLGLMAPDGTRAVLDGGQVGQVLVVPEETALTLGDLVLRNGYSDESGGAFALFGGSLSMTRVELTGNVAGEGGGAMLYSANAMIVDSRILGNRSEWGESGGGGLGVTQIGDGLSVTLRRTLVAGNEAANDGYGGGLSFVSFADTDVLLDRVTLQENTARDGAGAFFMSDGGYIHGRATRVTVRGHVGAAGSYGALSLFATPGSQVDLDLADGLIADNLAEASPALSLFGLPGGAPGVARARLLRTKVYRNSALSTPPTGPVGAIGVFGDAMMYLSNADLGSGANDNPAGDLAGCSMMLGARVTGWVSEVGGDYCP
jgi:hypothetical protein